MNIIVTKVKEMHYINKDILRLVINHSSEFKNKSCLENIYKIKYNCLKRNKNKNHYSSCICSVNLCKLENMQKHLHVQT